MEKREKRDQPKPKKCHRSSVALNHHPVHLTGVECVHKSVQHGPEEKNQAESEEKEGRRGQVSCI